MGSLGWPEILIILVIALIVFGPRKLPELGKSIGQGLAQFRRASEDFKRTWEDEVQTEKQRLSTGFQPEGTSAREPQGLVFDEPEPGDTEPGDSQPKPEDEVKAPASEAAALENQ